MGFLRPRSYPIRKIDENKQQLGRIYNPKRYPDHGGFSSASVFPGGTEPFKVEPPEKGMRSAEQTGKTTTD